MPYIHQRFGDIGLFILRAGVAAIFIFAGLDKLLEINSTAAFLEGLNFPNPMAMAWLLAITEFFGGILILFGAYTKIPAGMLAIVMIVAIYTTKLDGNFADARLNIMLLSATLALFFTGAGDYSVDYKIRNR
jgi:putative oxidoreductase